MNKKQAMKQGVENKKVSIQKTAEWFGQEMGKPVTAIHAQYIYGTGAWRVHLEWSTTWPNGKEVSRSGIAWVEDDNPLEENNHE